MTINDTEDKQYMLTTIDNPYNPFTQYDEWYALDEALGYHSTGLLARYTITSDALSAKDQEIAINLGILEIIQDNPFGMYKRVINSDYSS